MKIIFAGTPDFAVPTLQMLLDSQYEICAVYTQPDRPAGRGRKLKPSPVKELALQAGLAIFQPESFKPEQELQKMAALGADLMVVIAYGMILPQAILDIPRLGCVNVHASLLPRWRGAAPIQRALMAGDDKTGVTIMNMVRKLDAGDMLHKEECTIDLNETAGQLHDKLARLGALGLSEVLPQLEQGTTHPEKQDESLVTYAEKLEKSEALIDWSQPAEELARKVRGFNPWPVAHTVYRGKTLRIWNAEAVSGNQFDEPGLVQPGNGKRMEVATGEGLLKLLEVQLAGGKRMDVQAFLNAHEVEGVRLG